MITEDRLKDSTLSNDASIYQKREVISELDKWKSLKGKEKWGYFNQYYRNKIIVAILSIGFVVYMIITMLTPKVETQLFVAVINNALSQNNIDIIKPEFGQLLELPEDDLSLIIDNTFQTSSSGEYSEFTVANETKLGTYIFAGDIDVMIVNEADFASYAAYGNYIKLADVLPTDLISKLANEFVEADLITEDNLFDEIENPATERGVYGISLKNALAFDTSIQRIENPILAIVANSEQKDNVIEFIRYLFQLN